MRQNLNSSLGMADSEGMRDETIVTSSKVGQRLERLNDMNIVSQIFFKDSKIQLVANAKDAVSGSVTIGSAQEVMNIAYGDAVTFATDSYKRKGYVLTGFSTNKNGKGTKYALNEAQYVLSTKANKTIKLYAVWEKVKTVKVSDVTISSAAGEIVVQFAPNADCNTYEISYSPTIMMRDAKILTVSTENADNAIISDVEAGMRYYVRVREVRYDSCGNAITGKWSTLRTTIVAE